MRPLRTPLPAPILAALALALLAALAVPDARALTAQHRLDRVVVPTSEALRLELDAGKTDYSGSARIALKVTAPTDSFELNAEELHLAKMELRGPHGAAALKWTEGPHGVLTVRAPRKLAPGAYTLTIEFTNNFDTRVDGLYKLESGGDAYVVSQFEAISARQAFPCWDEPEYKIPWQLTLVVPKAHMAISNTPALRD